MESGEFELLLGENRAIHDHHYGKFSPDESMKAAIREQPPLKIIVITEPWCGDSLASVPVLLKTAGIHGHWDVRFLLRDENPGLMNKFLTRGGRAVPVFLFLNGDGTLNAKWGPRPDEAQRIFEEQRGKIDAGLVDRKEVHMKIRRFYASDRGRSIVNTIIDRLKDKISEEKK